MAVLIICRSTLQLLLLFVVSSLLVNGFITIGYVPQKSKVTDGLNGILDQITNSDSRINIYYAYNKCSSLVVYAKPRPIDLLSLTDLEAFEKELFQTNNNQESDGDNELSDIDDDDEYFNNLKKNQDSGSVNNIKKILHGSLVSTHPIPNSLDSIRIDTALATIIVSCQFPIDISRVQSTQILEAGCVSINGIVVTRKATKVQIGQILTIDWKKVFTNSLLGDKYSFNTYDIQPENIPLDIIYEDDTILVINKQADMVVHPGAGNWNGTIVNAVAYYLQNQSPYRVSELFNAGNDSINNNIINPADSKDRTIVSSILDDESDTTKATTSSVQDSTIENAIESNHKSAVDIQEVEDESNGSNKENSDNVLDLVRTLMEQQQQIQDQSSLRPGIIHRLDKGTTGVMVIGKTTQAVRDISNQFATRSKTQVSGDSSSSSSLQTTIDLLSDHKSTTITNTVPSTNTGTSVKKIYLACTVGKHPSNNVILNKPIRRHRTNRQQMCVIQSHDPDGVYYDFDDDNVQTTTSLSSSSSSSGKDALSVVDTIEYNSQHQIGFVQVQIYTGRTHQIRVHLQDYSTPIIGDDVYGNKVYNERYFSTAKDDTTVDDYDSSSTTSTGSTKTIFRATKKLTKAQRQDQRRNNRLNRRPYLHAHQLSLTHPVTHQIITFVAPLPNDMKQFIQKYSLVPEQEE